MNKPALVGSLVVVALGAFFAGRYTRKASPEDHAKAKHILYYVDPMHPAYKSDKPGTAPDCGMTLEPVYEGDDLASKLQPGPGAVAIAEWPTTPDPPVRLMTLNGCLSSFSSTAATMRAVASVPPPAAHGQMMVTGRLGQG